ncbi:MAG TPA: hypothetical protein VJ799_03430, partial [Nitrososphaeraceae archaeon]|nr:hypothetical protein [Nitrososphaeraceae archaeon]
YDHMRIVTSIHKEPISLFPILLVNFIGTLDFSIALLPLSQSCTRVQSSRVFRGDFDSLIITSLSV